MKSIRYFAGVTPSLPWCLPWYLVWCLLCGLLAACGGGGGSGGSANTATVASSGQSAQAAPENSWYSTAQPLVQRYCVACHSDGGSTSFALQTYEQVEAKRSALVYVLESGSMPPPGYAGPNAAETRLLLDWLAAGAPRGDKSQAPQRRIAGNFTYHGEARAIIEQHCVDCHQDGGIAPFPLDNYKRVKSVAAASAFAVANGSMPPWPPTPGYTAFDHDRALPPEQRYVLLNWLRGELSEGDPADYQPPTESEESNPPQFNLRLPLPQAYTPTVRPDDHRCFAIEWPLDGFTYVTEVDVLPDQLAEVHHVIVSIAEPEDAATYYAADGEDGRPGWYCLGAGGVPGAPLPRQIGGWVPGAGREPAPKGTGIGVKPGSVMVVQMHYNTLVAEPVPDQSTVLVATAEQVARPARSFLLTDPQWLQPGGMPIPAGKVDVRHEMTFPAYVLALLFGEEAGVLPSDPWVMHNGFVHMHNLGETGRITLLRSDGTEQVLLDIPNWDFNWQGTYRFGRELLIQPTDRLKLECSWDNSQQNQPLVQGEQLQAQYVEWGDGTRDEMCLMSVLMTQPKTDYDYAYSPTLHIAAPTHRQQFAPGDLVPLRLILNNFSLSDPGQHNHEDAQLHMAGEHSTAESDHGGVYNGHYHVYLDTDDDDAEHLTAWDDNYYYQLPADISPGLHVLRVNLRGADHHALGIEQEVEIEVLAASTAAGTSLIDASAWQEQGAAEDSWPGHRPEEVNCPANSWYEEDDALEVETGYCDYLSLAQPSLVEVAKGEMLHLVLWHGDLAFEQPAASHVAVSVGGQVLWQAEVEIPGEANIFDVSIPVPEDLPKGAVVEYHLHNHGYNTWTLLRLELEP